MQVSLYMIDMSQVATSGQMYLQPYGEAFSLLTTNGAWSLKNSVGSIIWTGKEIDYSEMRNKGNAIQNLPENYVIIANKINGQESGFVVAFDREARDAYENAGSDTLEFSYTPPQATKGKRYNWELIIPIAGVVLVTMFVMANDKKTKDRDRLAELESKAGKKA